MLLTKATTHLPEATLHFTKATTPVAKASQTFQAATDGFRRSDMHHCDGQAGVRKQRSRGDDRLTMWKSGEHAAHKQ